MRMGVCMLSCVGINVGYLGLGQREWETELGFWKI